MVLPKPLIAAVGLLPGAHNARTWLGAGALGIFTLIATLIAHPFWRMEGHERFMQMNIFLEHMSLFAAFVLVAILSTRRRDVSQ